jgi:hypothetical protein
MCLHKLVIYPAFRLMNMKESDPRALLRVQLVWDQSVAHGRNFVDENIDK